jgi:hypothetical protein
VDPPPEAAVALPLDLKLSVAVVLPLLTPPRAPPKVFVLQTLRQRRQASDSAPTIHNTTQFSCAIKISSLVARECHLATCDFKFSKTNLSCCAQRAVARGHVAPFTEAAGTRGGTASNTSSGQKRTTMEAAGQAQAVNGGHSNAEAKARQGTADTRERGKPSALNALTFANCSEGQGAQQSHVGQGGRGNATTAGAQTSATNTRERGEELSALSSNAPHAPKKSMTVEQHEQTGTREGSIRS